MAYVLTTTAWAAQPLISPYLGCFVQSYFLDLNGCRRVTMRSIAAFLNGERPANEKTAELVAASKARYAAGKATDESEVE